MDKKKPTHRIAFARIIGTDDRGNQMCFCATKTAPTYRARLYFGASGKGLSRPLIHDQAKGYAPFPGPIRTNAFARWIAIRVWPLKTTKEPPCSLDTWPTLRGLDARQGFDLG